MRINNNLMAMNTHRQLGVANNAGAKSMEKLSSGYRINRAGDDAAGLAISEKMRGQIRGLNQASTNAQDGISMIQTAEGGLQEVHAILQRMRELAVQGANDTYTTEDRGNITDELTELLKEVGRIKNSIEFNTKNLLDGSAGTVNFQVGANANQRMDVSFAINGINLGGVSGSETASGVYGKLSGILLTLVNASGTVIGDGAAFSTAIDNINAELSTVSKGRSLLGAAQNRLEHTIKNLDNAAENLQAAESRIRDVDMAKEMMEQTKQNILQQASTAMLAQANQAPQTVLQLLR